MSATSTETSRPQVPTVAKLPPARNHLAWLPSARLVSQAFFLCLFAYLFLSATVNLPSPLPVDFFLRIDPLIGLSASLANRNATPTLFWSLPLLLGTLVLGRFFCGWICPLGTTLDAARLRSPNEQDRITNEGRWRRTKYLLLALLLAAAALGNTTLLALDPLSLLTRSGAILVFPAIDHLFSAGADLALSLGVPLTAVLDAVSLVRGTVLPIDPGLYALAPLSLLMIAAVVGLNAVAHRFWCRYLCPLGALLALASRWSLVKRRASACLGCQRCVAGCRTGAIIEQGQAVSVGECVLCLQCQHACPSRAISYGPAVAVQGYAPSRRQLLLAVGAAAVGVATLSVSPANAAEYPYLIRPPGAQKGEFLSACVRCGQCMKVCPTGGLQPSLSEGGLAGLWSPLLVPRLGPCDYQCHACGQVCPTGAIPALTLSEKQETKIGTAYIDRNRCLPWADNVPCAVCQEVCQVPTKAITLEVVSITDAAGAPMELKRPLVLREKCIGCGVCEHNCPVPGPAAIRVMTA